MPAAGGTGRRAALFGRDSALFSRVSQLLDQSLELQPEQRESWLAGIERSDPEAAAALGQLLQAEGACRAAGFLEHAISGLQELPAQVDEALVGQKFGPYRVRSLLGRGGMGSVWLAERADGLFTREVALKLVHPALMGRGLTERMAREREILASLAHPNIARLFDAGLAADGQPYLALEYVAGTPITEYSDRERLPLRDRLILFRQVLGAVQYAHAHLVVHRDLKPSNVLVTDEGEVRLLDFGIAKLLTEGAAKETELTQLGGRALTPDYAAPEQILGAPVTTATDVYALGVLLFELLTGERPYQLKRDSRGALEEAILEAEPLLPSRVPFRVGTAVARVSTPGKLVRALRGDLDTIVLKALRKTPAERYATADAFGEDINRYLRGDAVLAQPDRFAYRAAKFVWRNRVPLATGLLVFLALAAGLAGTAYEARLAAVQRDVAVRDHLRLLTQTAAARLKQGDAPGAMSIILEILRLRLPGAGRTPEALSVFEEARAADTQLTALTGHADRVTSAAFSPDGRRILTASYDRTARIWDAVSGLQLISATGHAERLSAAQFSNDGQQLVTASADGTARIWDATTARQRIALTGHQGPVTAAAFSPDGRRVVTASIDKTARMWNAVTGQPILVLAGHTEQVNFSGFFPLDNRLLTTSDDGTARIWSGTTGKELMRLRGHTEYVQSAALSPDGRRTVTVSFDKSARIWDNATGRQLAQFTNTAPCVAASYSHRGDRIAVACFDNTARVLSAASGELVDTLSGHTGLVLSAAYAPDDRRIVTSSSDHTARVWATQPRGELLVLNHANRVTSAVFSRDGERVVTSSYDKTLRLWDAASGRQLMQLDAGQAITSVALSPDGRLLATGSDEKTPQIWDSASGRLIASLQGHTARVNNVEFSPDGTRVVTASNDRTVRIWDVASGRQSAQLNGHADSTIMAEFSPDGQRVITGSADRTVRIWDAATARQLMELDGHTDTVNSVQFSPDGQRILTASDDGTARIWDARNGTPILELRGHRGGISNAVFAPDGQRIATSSFDRTVRIWDSRSGQLLTVLSGHPDSVNDVEFSPDGHRLVTSSDDRTARLWDAATVTLETQIAWSEAAQFDPLSAKQRSELGLVAPADVRLWNNSGTACDEAAAAPYDPDRRAPGVMPEALVADLALRSCSADERDSWMAARLFYQRGRALVASGAFAPARTAFESAQERGYRAARVDLARLLSRPEAGMLDAPRAVSLLEHAWKDGVTIAAFDLGGIYERGIAVPGDPAKYQLPPDPTRAASWYGKAMQAGEPNALAHMGEQADRRALEASTTAGRNALWLEAFGLYAAAAERTRVEDWPDQAWRRWRYRRASLARLLEREGMVEEVANAYESARTRYADRSPALWKLPTTLYRKPGGAD